MDEESLEQNMNTLEEMVLDEEKLVTYLSLSKELCLHVNSSKALLKSFADKILKKKPVTELNIKYIISGLSGDGRARTMVVSEDELDKTRSELQVVFFEHIYSICKGNAKVDEVALTLVNKFDDFTLCSGLIKNIQCAKRSADEMGALKTISQEITKQHSQKPQASKSFFGNKKPKEENKEGNENTKKSLEKQNNHGDSHTSLSSNKSDKTNGTPKKSELSVKTEPALSPKKKSPAKVKPDNKNQKGIAGFFNKQNGAPPKKISKETVEVKKESANSLENKPVKKETVKSDEMEVDVEEKKPVQKSNGHKNSKESKTKSKPNNKLNQIKKTAKVEKKRKRVLHVSDSESDGEKDDPFVDVDDSAAMDTQESEDEIPPTPNVSTVKITSGIVNPKKKRKIVDKTYTDEDGYILTKKEEVYESCSDHDDEGASKENVVNTVTVKKESPKQIKAPAKTSKKKISPPQKGKQATMMNFFQKK